MSESNGHQPNNGVNGHKKHVQIPATSDAHEGVGDANIARGQIETALQRYRKAVNLAETNADSSGQRSTLGDAYVFADLTLSALRQFRTAIRQSPRRAQPHFSLAELYRRYGKMQDALVEYRTAIECDPRNAYYHYKLGDALSIAGFVPEAIGELEAAIELAPSDAFYHFWVSDLYLMAARLDDAISEMQQAAMFAPYDDYYNMRLAVLYMLGGHTSDAAGALLQAVKLAPNNPIYHSLLGDVYSTDELQEHMANLHYELAGPLDGYDATHLKRLRTLIALKKSEPNLKSDGRGVSPHE